MRPYLENVYQAERRLHQKSEDTKMGRVYCVSYDLNKPGQAYDKLIEELKKTAWWHFLKSTWLIETEESAEQVWNRIEPRVDKSDNVIIIEVTSNYSGWLPKEAWDWIRERVQRRVA
jgi:hypothetical protein